MIEILVNSSLDNSLLILILIVLVERKVLRVLTAPEIIIRTIREILKESSPLITI